MKPTTHFKTSYRTDGWPEGNFWPAPRSKQTKVFRRDRTRPRGIHGLYAIVDTTFSGRGEVTSSLLLARDYLRGGAPILQLRDKRRDQSEENGRLFRDTCHRIAALKKDHPFLFIVNDDLKVALEVGADGVHVGKDDLPIEECRQLAGGAHRDAPLLVGYSAHSMEEAVDAERRGADYVAFGAIFPTPTKGPGHPIQGIGRLREVVSALKVPVVAIGGIGRDNIKEVLATGVASVAMISALAQASDRVAEVRFYSGLFAAYESERRRVPLRRER